MTNQMGKQAVLGAVAGVAGTALLRSMMAGSRRFAPETIPPMKQDPGEYIVEQAEKALPRHVRKKIPVKAENVAAVSLAFGYGATFGMLYGAMRAGGRSDSVTRVFSEGAALGATSWAVGFLGWLPATRLMPPVHKQKAKQVVPSILSHVLFGIVTVGLFRCLSKNL